jgi:hypothetical protein
MICTEKEITPPMFAIDTDNKLRVLTKDYGAKPNETLFSTLKDLVEISQAHNWSKSDVTDVWNAFAAQTGLKPQKQFKNRLYGLKFIFATLSRSGEIMEAIETIGAEPSYQDTPAVAKAQTEASDNSTQGEPVKTKKKRAKAESKVRTPRKTAAKAEKSPRKPRAAKNPKDSTPPRSGSNLATLIRMMSRKAGATVPEVMEATGWTATHTVRGRISILGSKGMKIERVKDESRGSVYRIVA